MASVYTGALTIGQETSHGIATMMAGYPPAEVIAFDYQMNYLAHGNDVAGWASELEANRQYARQWSQDMYGFWKEGKSNLKNMRSDAYNDLEYFTTDPTRSAFMRPDKMTGDFFEKFIPMMVSLALPTKASAVANFGKLGTVFTQFTWIGTQAFNNGAAERAHTLINNPHMLDNNSQFQEFCRNSPLSQKEARATFIEAEGRRAGVQAGMLSLVTAGVSYYLRSATSTGTEGAVLKFMQDWISGQIHSMASEAVNGVDENDIRKFEKGENREDY